MKKIISTLAVLSLLAVSVFASTLVTNVDMRRDADNNWNGKIYEAEVVDSQLKLYLLGKKLDRDECSNWDLVLEDNTGEIYRDVGKVTPSRLYTTWWGGLKGGTWTTTTYIDLDEGTYNDVLVRYDCTTNNFWDISAAETFDVTIEEAEEEPEQPHNPYCSWYARWRGYC